MERAIESSTVVCAAGYTTPQKLSTRLLERRSSRIEQADWSTAPAVYRFHLPGARRHGGAEHQVPSCRLAVPLCNFTTAQHDLRQRFI